MHYAFSTRHHFAFIAAAKTQELLALEIDRIIINHTTFARDYISPGIFLCEAHTLAEAKLKLIRDAGREKVRPVMIDLDLFHNLTREHTHDSAACQPRQH